jgi:hypothetical protein
MREDRAMADTRHDPLSQQPPVPTCACCGRDRRRLAELGATPGVFICRVCALWAWRRATKQ